MKFRTSIQLYVCLLLVLALTMISAPVWATGDDDCRSRHEQCGHNDGGEDGGDGQDDNGGSTDTSGNGGAGGLGGSGGYGGSSSVGDTTIDTSSLGIGGDSSVEIGDTLSTSSSNSNAYSNTGDSEASVGDININSGNVIPADTTHKASIKIENTPDTVTITPGSGDSCKAHVGGNLSLPGFGTGLTIPLPGKECRKLKYYDRMVAIDDLRAAEIIFCSLKEVAAEFRKLDLPCLDTLSIYVVPPKPPVMDVTPTLAPPGAVYVPIEEYDQLLMAQQQTEEFEEQQQMVQDKFAKYDNLIEVREAELARLQREAAALKAAQEARKAEEAATRAKFKARLAEEQSDE